MAYKSKYRGYQVEGLLDKADTSVQLSNIKTINGCSIIGNGDIAISTHNKGYFADVDNLRSYYSSGSPGDVAYIGTSYPYAIYKWDEDQLD